MQTLSTVASKNSDSGSGFCEAAELIATSWRENKEQALDYNAAFLQSCYEYPGVDTSLSPAIFVDSRMVAMASAFPRSVLFDRKLLRLAMLTFCTVAPEMKGKGLGLAVWRECLQRVRAAGYDGAIHYCVEGNKSNFVTVAAAETLGFEACRVFTVQQLMRFIPESTPTTKQCISDVSFRRAFATHAARLAGKEQFARTWSEREIDWECHRRYGAVCASCNGNPDDGLLTGYVIGTAADAGVRCLFFENIFWGNLDDLGRELLVTSLLSQVAGQAQIAAVPLFGYADMSVFARLGFRKTVRKTNLYLTVWNGVCPRTLSSAYMDLL
jgi:hypothetical protein